MAGAPHLTGEPTRMVVALGGNALLRRGDRGTVEEQYLHADAVMRHVADLAAAGHRLVITHGNGPVVGNIVLRNEAARASVPPMPLYIDDADSEGGIGLMLQMALHNRLRAQRIARAVVTIVTQVVVDPLDPAFARPDKPIGPFYSPAEKDAVAAEEPSWVFAETGEADTWRRVVPSPKPLRVVEAPVITRVTEHGDIVIAAGGGGVPVVEDADGTLTGIDAVIDKDRTSSLLALQTGASVLAILMEEDAVYLGYGQPGARALGHVHCGELCEHLARGEFHAGSIAPKVEAACDFVRHGGETAVICRAENLTEALRGHAGTRVTA
ncbi:MAG: carbamate kinase [Actinobacteria bacterium]|nr:MAG: carbamate kinase [Actinomycetota bacterium]